jgi:hypothetical protein
MLTCVVIGAELPKEDYPQLYFLSRPRALICFYLSTAVEWQYLHKRTRSEAWPRRRKLARLQRPPDTPNLLPPPELISLIFVHCLPSLALGQQELHPSKAPIMLTCRQQHPDMPHCSCIPPCWPCLLPPWPNRTASLRSRCFATGCSPGALPRITTLFANAPRLTDVSLLKLPPVVPAHTLLCVVRGSK